MQELMSEHRLGGSATLGGTTIIPIETVIYSAGEMDGGVWLNGSVEPMALIIIKSGTVKVLDIKLGEISLQDIQEAAPELTGKIDQRINQISDGVGER